MPIPKEKLAEWERLAYEAAPGEHDEEEPSPETIDQLHAVAPEAIRSLVSELRGLQGDLTRALEDVASTRAQFSAAVLDGLPFQIADGFLSATEIRQKTRTLYGVSESMAVPDGNPELSLTFAIPGGQPLTVTVPLTPVLADLVAARPGGPWRVVLVKPKG